MTTTIVLGAGYVGSAVALAVAARGERVVAVRRTPTAIGEGVELVAGDLHALEEAPLPSRAEHVVLTVAPSRGRGDDYADTYLPAATAAARLAERLGARSLTYTSSTGVYDGTGGAWVTEASPTLGRALGGAVLREAEERLLSARVPTVTVLRVSGIYGPGRSPVARYEHPEQLPARGEYYVNFAHRDDIVAAIHLARDPPGGRRVLNCSDGSPVRAIDVARWVAERRGRPLGQIAFAEPDAAPRSDQRVDCGALRALGWTPRFPSFRGGFATLMDG